MTPDESLLTADEVARTVQLSSATVRRWARRGLVPSITLPGGQFRFRRTDIDALLGNLPEAEQSERVA